MTSETRKMLSVMSKAMKKCLQPVKFNETVAMTILIHRHFNFINLKDFILINENCCLSQNTVC